MRALARLCLWRRSVEGLLLRLVRMWRVGDGEMGRWKRSRICVCKLCFRL